MSYLVLIKATCGHTGAAEIYGISTAINVENAVAAQRAHCPIPITLEHSIRAGTRTEYLERTLQIKFKALKLHSYWYLLSAEDIAWLKTLNEQNFNSIAGFVNKAAAPTPPPVIAAEALPDFITTQLELAAKLLK